MIKAILFDFNGTMFFDSKKHHEAWSAFSMKYCGKPLTQQDMSMLHGKNNFKIIQTLRPDFEDEDYINELSKEKEAMYRQSCLDDPDFTKLASGLEDFMQRCLDQGIKMTICSASIYENIQFFIEIFDLKRFFDCDKIIYDDGFHEDKVSMFLDGAKELNVDISECVVFEDSFSGLRFAHEAGAGKIICICEEDKKSEYNDIPYIDDIIHTYENLSTDILQK